MSAEAIYNVTIALRDRLKAAVTGHGISGNVFVGPPNEVSSGADLILFLYRVCPAPRCAIASIASHLQAPGARLSIAIRYPSTSTS